MAKTYKKRKDEGPDWGLIVFLFIIGAWPIALVLLLVKLKAMADSKREQQQWDAGFQQQYRAGEPGSRMTGQPGFSVQPAAGGVAYTYAPDPHSRISTDQKKKLSRYKLLSTVLVILGAVVALFGLPGLLECLMDLRYGLFDSFTVEYSLVPALSNLLAGGAMGFFGSRMKRNMNREKLMATITGQSDNISIKELSAASGYTQKETLDLVKDAIGHGLFGPKAYVDMRTKTLVVRGQAPAPAPKKSPNPQKQAEVAANAAAKKKESEYETILRRLREVNDAIPGQAMSEKIYRLEDTAGRIFALARQDEKKKAQLSKFMDYYLPTALKLLDTYATLDKQGLQGQNVTETKASIENAMDLLVKAFEGQLDKMFQTDALDVSGDIAALQSMLTMDGLTEDSVFSAEAVPAAPGPEQLRL